MATDPAPVEIVLVEDNPDDVFLARRAFVRHGLANALRVFAAGEEALEWLRSQSEPNNEAYDVVLLDLRLPGLNGLDVLRAIRADPRRRNTFVIVLTAANAFDDIADAYAAGASAVMFKPIDFGQLVERVAELGLGWRLLGPSSQRSPSIARAGSEVVAT